MKKQRLHQAIIAVLASLLFGTGSHGYSVAFGAPASYPPFSWRHVPTYADLGSYTGFTSAEAKFLATHFSALSIEKAQGWALRKPGEPRNGESEFLRTARQLKKFNPRVCVLFYWNADTYYPFYQADDALRANWVSAKKEGGLYKISNLGFQRWWVNVAANMVAHKNVDGIFVDDGIPPAGCDPQTTAAILAIEKRLYDKLASLNKPSLVLLNGLENCINSTGLNATKAKACLRYSDGAMLEHFDFVYSGDPTGSAPKRIRAEMMAIMAEAKTGKIVVVKGWPNFNWLTPGLNKIPYPTLVKRARKDITFPLACFLICAQRYTYFDYSWGYNQMDQGSIVLTPDEKKVDQRWYPQLEKPLGHPLGVPHIHGYIFTRKFQHASVWVDLSTHQARIQWR